MRYLKLTLIALLALVVVAFTIQNSSRTAELSLDLWVAAWELRDPAPIPVLLWGAFLVGALAVGALALQRIVALNRRVRRLEQEIALAGPSSSASAPHADGWA